jgi:hypothetical protein
LSGVFGQGFDTPADGAVGADSGVKTLSSARLAGAGASDSKGRVLASHHQEGGQARLAEERSDFACDPVGSRLADLTSALGECVFGQAERAEDKNPVRTLLLISTLRTEVFGSLASHLHLNGSGHRQGHVGLSAPKAPPA